MVQFSANSLSSVEQCSVIETEPYHGDDLLDFVRGIGWIGKARHWQRLSGQYEDSIAMVEDEVECMVMGAVHLVERHNLIEEKVEVISDREAGSTRFTAEQVEGVALEGLDGSLFAAGFRGCNVHGLLLVEFGIKKGVREYMVFEEGFVYALNSADGSADECLQSDLIDDSGQALGKVEDDLDGIVSKEFFWSFGALEVEGKVSPGVIEGKASEVVRETDALFEGFVLGRSDASGQF